MGSVTHRHGDVCTGGGADGPWLAASCDMSSEAAGEHSFGECIIWREKLHAKTFLVPSPSLDRVPRHYAGFDQYLGHPLEIVPLSHPVTPMGPGQTIKIRLLFHGKPYPEPACRLYPAAVHWLNRLTRNTNAERTKVARQASRRQQVITI